MGLLNKVSFECESHALVLLFFYMCMTYVLFYSYEMHKTAGASESVCRMCKTPLPTTCAACRMSPQLQDNRNSMQVGSSA